MNQNQQQNLNIEQIKQRKADATVLREHWDNCIPTYTPETDQFYRWIGTFGTAIIVEAIEVTAKRMCMCKAKGSPMTPDHLVRFAAGCMWNMLRGGQNNG